MTTETAETKAVKFDHWCIVELMGHQKIAGKVTEENLFGTALMRVDVPGIEGMPAFTKYYGASAIYAVTPVEERVARAVASSLDTRPVQTWQLQKLLSEPERLTEVEPSRRYDALTEDELDQYRLDEDESGVDVSMPDLDVEGGYGE